MLLSATYYDSDGQDRLFYKQFDTPAQNNGVAQNMDGDTSASLFGSLGYGDFTLESAFNQRVKFNPTAQFALTTFDNPRLRTIDEQNYSSLKYAHSFPDVVDVTAQVYYDGYTHAIGYPQSVPTNNLVSRQIFHRKGHGRMVGRRTATQQTRGDRHVLTLGAEYRDDFLQDSRVVVQGQPDRNPTPAPTAKATGSMLKAISPC